MLLLDQNLPHQLRELLKATRLASRLILTRDVLFGEAAARALAEFPDLAVVVIRLPQRAWRG